ncbi:hypothetical protein ACWT_0593 [Actinoplanes sp. SE50]|nr:hypothetical protein ACPL_710 [Actinoplanes sp. SE50/110]ATO80008.1 hypothetical protein ACWT_0593 [Actinoplanes sp. SE50]SLL97412.1 hypothetical protein ACSP50_0615 [Actinoplanes sp. SE50/110]
MTLIAGSEWAETVVLRGSMAMPAWVGDAARPPGDLDLILLPSPIVGVDTREPWPFVPHLGPSQHWPEAVHGGARNEIWTFEEFETGGLRPVLPPEGLHWMTSLDVSEPFDFAHQFLIDLLTGHPRTPDGVLLDLDAATENLSWDYSEPDEYTTTSENGRARLRIPWTTPAGLPGHMQIDLSYDEPLPTPPVLTAVPRVAAPPIAVLTAGRELSLAWKLHWLAADQQSEGRSAAKDLYDAVLLAELPQIRLRPRLQRLALPQPLSPTALAGWTIDGPLPGGPAPWLTRLATALPHLTAAPAP